MALPEDVASAAAGGRPVPERTLPVVFVLGATASGKTALTLALAQHCAIEIISVDSGQVYRGMDIGTAKPSAAERAAVPHHLIDICTPDDPYTAARFCEDAAGLIDAIRERSRLPVLAGGTMLYFQALEHGLAPLPSADAGLRAAIVRDAGQRGWPALHADLARVDPAAAARIQPNDPQRLQRALEVYRLTGQRLSDLQQQRVSRLAGPAIKFALQPPSRAWLHARIAARFDQMLAAGFLDEVAALRRQAGVHADLPAMRSVGYRQALRHLDGQTTRQQFIDQSLAATRQLAKRQLTWMRGMHDLHELPCAESPSAASLAPLLKQLQSHEAITFPASR